MQTAYLKAHYPLEYMAAVLTSYTGKTDKIVHYVAECNRAGYTVLPPDVNTSGADFTPVVGEGIRFGLAGIRGVGEGVVAEIARRARGGRRLHVAAGLLRARRHAAGQQEDDRGAGQGRRVRLDRLHAQAPALDDGLGGRLGAQAGQGRRLRPGLDVRHVRRRGLGLLRDASRRPTTTSGTRRCGWPSRRRCSASTSRTTRFARSPRRSGAPPTTRSATSTSSPTARPGGSRAFSPRSRQGPPRRGR